MNQWVVFICECGRRYAIEEVKGDEVEEPCCPTCGSDNSVTEGYVDVHFRQPVLVN